MAELNIIAEGAGSIEVDVTQEYPQVSLQPTENPLDVNRTTKELFIADELQLKEAASQVVESEITQRVYTRVIGEVGDTINTTVNTAINNYDNSHKVVINESKEYEDY